MGGQDTSDNEVCCNNMFYIFLKITALCILTEICLFCFFISATGILRSLMVNERRTAETLRDMKYPTAGMMKTVRFCSPTSVRKM